MGVNILCQGSFVFRVERSNVMTGGHKIMTGGRYYMGFTLLRYTGFYGDAGRVIGFKHEVMFSTWMGDCAA